MNLSILSQKAYENKSNWTLGENKPNSNPICEMPKMNVNIYYKREYNKKTAFWRIQNKPNQTQFKANTNPITEKTQNERKYLLYKGI